VPILDKFQIHPNMITILAFLPIYLIYKFINQKKIVLVYLFAFINYTMDCMDGELARYSKKLSKLGGILDSIHDLISLYTLFYLLLGPINGFVVLTILSLSIIFTFKMDPITHKPERFKILFYMLHDNINIFYYLLVFITYKFI